MPSKGHLELLRTEDRGLDIRLVRRRDVLSRGQPSVSRALRWSVWTSALPVGLSGHDPARRLFDEFQWLSRLNGLIVEVPSGW